MFEGIQSKQVALSTRREAAAMRLTLPSAPVPQPCTSQAPLVTQVHSPALLLASLSRRLSRFRDNFTSTCYYAASHRGQENGSVMSLSICY